MNVNLSPELEQFVEHRVKSGKNDSPNDVVGEALHLLEQRDEVLSLHAAEIRNQIEEGWHAAVKGRLVDGDVAFDRIDAELEALERPSQK